MSRLVTCDDDDIPLWRDPPTVANIPTNELAGHLWAHEPCVVLREMDDGTCLVAYDGLLAFAVTACLIEVRT